MKEIDTVVDKYGGWPGAFEAGDVQTTGRGEVLMKVAEPNADYAIAIGKGKK